MNLWREDPYAIETVILTLFIPGDVPSFIRIHLFRVVPDDLVSHDGYLQKQ
jgi:hypothetical protein